MKLINNVLLISLFLPLAAIAKGKIGISADVAVDGFFSPELIEFKIEKVHPGSPAEKAGAKVGQLVIELDGCKIPGCPADKAKKLMAKETGEILPLLVKNIDGSVVLLNIHVGS